MNELEIRAAKVIESLLCHEIGEYPYYEDCRIVEVERRDSYYHVEAKIRDQIDNIVDLYFRITFDEELKKFDEEDFHRGCTIEVLVSYDSDHYEKIETFEPSIKHLWIALLRV
jgi:hypothetical protein